MEFEDISNSSQILNEDELNHLNKIGWEDIEAELNQNKELLRKEKVTSSFDEKPPMAPEEFELDFIMDLPLQIVVEVGRNRILIDQFLNYEIDSIVELDKQIGEPLELFINGHVVGEGVIVVQNKRFCLKVTKLFDHVDKMHVIQSAHDT